MLYVLCLCVRTHVYVCESVYQRVTGVEQICVCVCKEGERKMECWE